MKKRQNLNIWLGMSMFLLLMVSTAMAEIIFVDADANGANDGLSWADAYNYLQDALADANSGDEIWVAQGIYKPDQGIGITPGGRTATFQLKNGVTIKGGYAGFGESDPNARDIELYETILSGDLYGDDIDVNDPCDLWNEPSRAENSFHVTTGSGTDETAVLDGFTITAGNAYERPWHPMVPDPNNWGGGMYNHSGSPTLLDCTFSRNSAEVAGGGMYNKEPTGGSRPTLTNCTFSGNSARSKDSRAGFGGGMYNSGSSPVLSKCTLSDNWAEKNGGGMCNGAASPIVLNCTFSGNSAGWGGGMRNSWGSSPIVTGCLFIGNSASGDGGGMLSSDSSQTVGSCIFIGNSAGERGGGMVNFSHSNLSLSNCVFTGNSATNGGGIYNSYSSMTLTSSTFAGNSGTNGSALGCDSFRQRYPSNLELTNCILWNGGDGVWNNDGSAIEISFSDLQGGETGVYDPCDGLVWGEGNIDTDPCFADPCNGDYHLLPDSPCIDAGNPDYVSGPNETDLDGKPRVIGGRIDMGAYEYSPPIPAEVRIVPRTINLTSKGKWINCYIGLPEEYNVADIDPNSVVLEDEIQAASLWIDEQEKIAVARFSRSEVQGILEPGEVELIVSGKLTDGTVFEGTDVIRVVDKGKKLNQPPNVTITKPEDGALFGPSETIEIEANAWDVDGSVVKVEFFANGGKIGEDNHRTDGWKTNWYDHLAATYSLTAKATDNDGAVTTSSAVEITVLEVPLPGQASNPNPANGATGVSTTADLSWTTGSNAVSHNVYFGTTSPGTFRGNQIDTTFDPGTMDSNTTYYWRIDEVNVSGTTTGTVWSFTTIREWPPV